MHPIVACVILIIPGAAHTNLPAWQRIAACRLSTLAVVTQKEIRTGGRKNEENLVHKHCADYTPGCLLCTGAAGAADYRVERRLTFGKTQCVCLDIMNPIVTRRRSVDSSGTACKNVDSRQRWLQSWRSRKPSKNSNTLYFTNRKDLLL